MSTSTKRTSTTTRTRAGDVITVLVIFYLVSVIAACLFLAGRELYQYEKARREYDTLDKELITPIPADGSQEGISEETLEEEIWWPQLEIDFDTYREINEDFVGILYFPLFDVRTVSVIIQIGLVSISRIRILSHIPVDGINLVDGFLLMNAVRIFIQISLQRIFRTAYHGIGPVLIRLLQTVKMS